MDDDIADALAGPVANEGRMMDLMRAHGASERAIGAFTSAVRLLAFVDPELSPTTRQVVRKELFPTPGPPPRPRIAYQPVNGPTEPSPANVRPEFRTS